MSNSSDVVEGAPAAIAVRVGRLRTGTPKQAHGKPISKAMRGCLL